MPFTLSYMDQSPYHPWYQYTESPFQSVIKFDKVSVINATCTYLCWNICCNSILSYLCA